jgi:hypothetical protein
VLTADLLVAHWSGAERATVTRKKTKTRGVQFSFYLSAPPPIVDSTTTTITMNSWTALATLAVTTTRTAVVARGISTCSIAGSGIVRQTMTTTHNNNNPLTVGLSSRFAMLVRGGGGNDRSMSTGESPTVPTFTILDQPAPGSRTYYITKSTLGCGVLCRLWGCCNIISSWVCFVCGSFLSFVHML